MTEDLRALLRSLPPDLPHPADRVERIKARAAARRRHRLVGLAAVAVVAVTVPVSVMLSARTAHGPAAVPAPLTCPNVYAGPAPWVPDGPRGVDGKSRLVPPQPPTRAVLCAYSGTNGDPQTGWLRDGSRVISGGLDRLAADLTLVSRRPGGPISCTLMGGAQVNYLLGLNYENGTLWVSASDEPNHCVATSNGRFTALDVSADLAAAYESGTWGQSPPPSAADRFPCTAQPTGRLGQEANLVPPGATSALICPEPMYGDGRSVTVTGADLIDLVEALNRLPTGPIGLGCVPTDDPPPTPRDYELLFRYPDGPGVLLRIMTGCQPSITNGNLAVVDAAPVADRIQHLVETG
jgi:hypothetical protein